LLECTLMLLFSFDLGLFLPTHVCLIIRPQKSFAASPLKSIEKERVYEAFSRPRSIWRVKARAKSPFAFKRDPFLTSICAPKCRLRKWRRWLPSLARIADAVSPWTGDKETVALSSPTSSTVLRLETHLKICTSHKERKIFNVAEKRVQGTEAEDLLKSGKNSIVSEDM